MKRSDIEQAVDGVASWSATSGLRDAVVKMCIQQVNAALGSAIEILIRTHLEMTIDEVIAEIADLKIKDETYGSL